MPTEEKPLLLDKSYTCPICDKKIKAKSVKTNVAKFVDTCMDLRPIYSNINVSKYDVVSCHNCGYTALTKYFDPLTQVQKKYIKDRICVNFKPREDTPMDFYTLDYAIMRLKMALLCATSKEGKSSEIGATCLKLSWLYQDKVDELIEEDPNYEALKENLTTEAINHSKHAYQYLSKARMEEDPPIAGMNEPTLDYLLAFLAYQSEEYNLAMQYLGGVISNKESTQRLKDKAIDLKEMLNQKMH